MDQTEHEAFVQRVLTTLRTEEEVLADFYRMVMQAEADWEAAEEQDDDSLEYLIDD